MRPAVTRLLTMLVLVVGLARLSHAGDEQIHCFDVEPQWEKLGHPPKPDSPPAKRVMIYFDDLSYTARRNKEYQPVFHKQNVTLAPYPEGGRKF